MSQFSQNFFKTFLELRVIKSLQNDGEAESFLTFDIDQQEQYCHKYFKVFDKFCGKMGYFLVPELER